MGSSETSEMESELTRYVAGLQADRLIEELKKRCPQGKAVVYRQKLMWLYALARGNWLLLDQSGWSESAVPMVEQARIACSKILGFMESAYDLTVDEAIDEIFEQAKPYACALDADDIGDCLDSTEEDLLAGGFRKQDIDLYVAGMQLNRNKVEILLQNGADPTVRLPYNMNETDEEKREYDSFYMRTSGMADDFFDVNDGMDYWRSGLWGEEVRLPSYYPEVLFFAAANKFLYDMACAFMVPIYR